MEDDRISNLPEEVLSHILSFLPTKKAVATSVLSKKWKSLWRSLPTLDFDDANYAITKEDYARFVQSVYAVILSRNLHQPIQKFRLNCVFSPYCHIANIKIWLNAVVQCGGLQHLDISIGYQQLTPAIFTCKTLVVLKLQLVDLKPLNSSVDLPFLTTLHMEDVFFSKLGCLAELLSGCPVLEDFKAENLEFGSQLTDKEFKTLPKLVRAEFSMMDKLFLMKVVSNVEFLHLNGFGWELSHDEHPGTNPYFPMFHNLTRLELFYRHCNNDWCEVVEFLKYCPKLQALLIEQPHLHGHAFDGFEEVGDWQYPPSVPECILLQLKSCYLNDYRGTEGEFQFARYILQNGNFLKRMTICSESTVSRQGKHKNFKKLSSCTRSSTTCELSFK